MGYVQPCHIRHRCERGGAKRVSVSLKMVKSKPQAGLGDVRSWFYGITHETNKCGAVFRNDVCKNEIQSMLNE
jgi:hypothetical protein